MSRQRVNRQSMPRWPLRDDADRHDDLVRSLTQPCLDYGPLDEELVRSLDEELVLSVLDPYGEPGPPVQELLHSLLDPRNDRTPLVVGKVAEDQSCDQKIRLVDLFCAPCASFVGWVTSYEVGNRLPGHLPYLILTRQIRGAATETEGALPEYRRCRVLLGDAGDPWLRQWMKLHQVSPPDELSTHCRDHGALTFSRRQVLGWAKEARQRILHAEQRGDTPKATRRKLRPTIVTAV